MKLGISNVQCWDSKDDDGDAPTLSEVAYLSGVRSVVSEDDSEVDDQVEVAHTRRRARRAARAEY